MKIKKYVALVSCMFGLYSLTGYAESLTLANYLSKPVQIIQTVSATQPNTLPSSVSANTLFKAQIKNPTSKQDDFTLTIAYNRTNPLKAGNFVCQIGFVYDPNQTTFPPYHYDITASSQCQNDSGFITINPIS